MAKFSMDQLSGRATVPSPRLSPKDFREEAGSTRHKLYSSDWVCVNHRGRDSTLLQTLGHGSTLLVLVTVVPLPLLLPALLILFLVRHWAQRPTARLWVGPRRLGRKRRILKRLVKGKARFSKVFPLRYKTYASLAKRDMQRISRVKVTKGSQVVRLSLMCRDVPQFT